MVDPERLLWRLAVYRYRISYNLFSDVGQPYSLRRERHPVFGQRRARQQRLRRITPDAGVNDVPSTTIQVDRTRIRDSLPFRSLRLFIHRSIRLHSRLGLSKE